MGERYKDHPRVMAYLEAVQADVVENHQNFRPQPPDEARPPMPGPRPDPFSRYHINVLVSRDGDGGAPVVSEFNPTYYNLVGRVDYQPAFGTLNTDYRLIKPGALHHANGGFLMLQARELLMNPFAWEGLKRCLTCEEVAIENIGEATSLVPTLTVRPEPIPLKVKVIVEGSDMTIDFSEMSPPVKGPFNSRASGTIARVAFKYLTTPHAPITEGGFRNLRIVCPEGTILSAPPTAPMSWFNMAVVSTIDLVLRAVQPAIPDAICAGSADNIGMSHISGIGAVRV